MTTESLSTTIKKAEPSQKLGLSFSNDGSGLRLGSMVPDSVAEKSDLNEGDKLISVDGEDVSAFSPKEVAALLRKKFGYIDFVVGRMVEPVIEDPEDDVGEEDKGATYDIAATSSLLLGLEILFVQVITGVGLLFFYDYGSVESFSPKQYMIFRDIMVMLLLGFGYLMTFLEKYGLGAVGFTMLLTALNMECNLLVEPILTGDMTISMDSIINAEFSAATLLISFGALIGRATPLQMCAIAIAESVFYALNKIYLVFGVLEAEDVGGTLTIHMFGAFFGLAAAYALGPQEKISASNNATSRVSDVFSLVGTTLLWVYWPSFVGATETGDDSNEMHCLTNTILSLIGSTGASFYLSQFLNNGKFDAVHIQNSTLAGGVAIGATGRLAMGPGIALLVGIGAGIISVLGYFYSSPFLEEKLGLFDTCGVGNLHGYPSVFGGLVSIFIVMYDNEENFLIHGLGTQSAVQLGAVVGTIISAVLSGFVTGFILLRSNKSFTSVPDYEDMVWWLFEE